MAKERDYLTVKNELKRFFTAEYAEYAEKKVQHRKENTEIFNRKELSAAQPQPNKGSS